MNYLYSRTTKNENTIVKVGDLCIGNGKSVIIAGPCSVENNHDLLELSKKIKNYGGHVLRGGAYKPRTSPYDFQGLGRVGLEYLNNAKEQTGLYVVSEITSIEQLVDFEKYVDIIQIGARNMQNFDLLKAVGKTNKPIILKRGFSNTIDEWLLSAEYILSQGNQNVILCERGIRTFENATRNTLDLSAICVIKQRSHLPIIVDPSHATGNSEYVEKMALAAIVAGADGIMVEVHENPKEALSDGAQSITPTLFKNLCNKIRKLEKYLESEEE